MTQSRPDVYMFPTSETHENLFKGLGEAIFESGLGVIEANTLEQTNEMFTRNQPLAFIISAEVAGQSSLDSLASDLVEQAHESGVHVFVLQVQRRNLGKKMLDLVKGRGQRIPDPDFLHLSTKDMSVLVDQDAKPQRISHDFIGWLKQTGAYEDVSGVVVGPVVLHDDQVAVGDEMAEVGVEL